MSVRTTSPIGGKRCLWRVVLGILLLRAIQMTPTARAEVSALPVSPGVADSLEFLDRGASPWRIWSPVRAGVNPSLLLNPSGDSYLDGAPSIVINPITRLPEAVWSYWDGRYYQIAYSRFDGASWTMAQTAGGRDYEFLTFDAKQNLDPRFWIDQAGNRRVTWWRQGPLADEVVVSVLPAGETQWWAPERVSLAGLASRRPDIRTTPYGTFVVAEEDTGGNLSVAVFAQPSSNGHVPQRESEPWGRNRVHSVAPGSSLNVAVIGVPSPGGEVPAITWREADLLATSLYDTEAFTWAAPSYAPFPIW